MIINGRIEQPGAWDVFGFQGRAGETIVAEVAGPPARFAARLGHQDHRRRTASRSPSTMTSPDKAAGLLTHHADSWLMVKLPADGTYYVHVCDVQRKAGPEYAYRLRISAPRPDFDLRVTPSGHQHSRRRDGAGHGACHPPGRL